MIGILMGKHVVTATADRKYTAVTHTGQDPQFTASDR